MLLLYSIVNKLVKHSNIYMPDVKNIHWDTEYCLYIACPTP